MRNSKRRIFFVLCLSFMLFLPGLIHAEKSNEQQPLYQRDQPSSGPSVYIGLKFYGAMNYMLASDINDHLQGTTNYWNDRGADVQGEFEALNWGFDFGGEFIIHFTPRFGKGPQFGIGLGGGYIQADSNSTVNNTWPVYSYQDTANPKVTAIPITMSGYFGFPLGSKITLTANVGVGYYLGTFNWNYGWDSEFDVFEENWEGKSNALGFHGGLGLEFNFSSNIALFIEGFGRYAKLKSLTGNYTMEETYFGFHGEESINDATLWYYERHSYLTGKNYHTINFDAEKPEETLYIKNIREGEVDLTGFSIRVGIKISFK